MPRLLRFDLVLVACMLWICAATTAQDVDSFRYSSDAAVQDVWRGTYPARVSGPKSDLVGVVFPCHFERAGDRCYWDRVWDQPRDFSSSQFFRISMHLTDGMNIKERSVAFGVTNPKDQKQIEGWYVYWLPDSPEGMQSFLMEKQDFKTEGNITGDGWSRIAQVRLSFFGGMNKSAADATVVELTASVVPSKSEVELGACPKPLDPTSLKVIPVPTQWQQSQGVFSASTAPLNFRSTSDAASERVIKIVSGTFQQLRGIELKKVGSLTTPKDRLVAWIGGEQTPLEARLKAAGASEPIPAEGYRLHAAPDGILLVASDEKGFFYAFQTLLQLCDVQEGKFSVPCGSIVDAPALPLRAIYLHWLGGEKGMQNAKKFIPALAALKYNALFIDVGGQMKYDRRPFPVTGANAFTKEQMRELADFARSYYVDLCPFYQMFGHTPWIGNEPAYRHLMENPAKVDWYSSWCASNPETFEFARDVLGEAVDVFRPPYVHISHDEIDFTDVGTCAKCKGKSKEDLIATSMNTLSDFLTSRGVKTIVSGDTFIPWLPRNSAENQLDGDRILQQVRKTLIINHWAYGGDYAMHETLMKAVEKFGFTGPLQTFSPWWHDWDMRISAQIIRDRKGLGVIGTTWHDWGSFENYPDQVADHSLGLIGITANFAWNPDSPAIGYADLDWNSRVQSLLEQPSGRFVKDEKAIPLTPYFNVGTQASAPRPGLPAWPVHTGDKVSGQPLFQLDSSPGFVMLRGHASEESLPKSVSIAVNRNGKTLYFYHALSEPYDLKLWQTPDRIQVKPPVGEYKVIFDDNTSVSIPLLFRLNITNWNSPYGYNHGFVAWQGADVNNRLVRIGCMPWKNPSPEKKIARIEFSSAMESGMNPMLFAIDAAGGRSK